MQPIWSWGGKHFGHRDGDDLWSVNGVHVGRFYGLDVFSHEGRYLGEVNRERLVSCRAKMGARMGAFTREEEREAGVTLAAYRAYEMPKGFEDFPGASEF